MTLRVEERSINGKTYRNINIKELGYKDTIRISLSFDEPMTGPGKFLDKNGQPKPYHKYACRVLQPEIGDVSFFSPDHLHRDLAGYKKGDVLDITAIEKFIELPGPDGKRFKKSYKGYEVKNVELQATDKDIDDVVEALKQVKAETGAYPEEVVLRNIMAGFGFKNEDDIQRILKKLA